MKILINKKGRKLKFNINDMEKPTISLGEYGKAKKGGFCSDKWMKYGEDLKKYETQKSMEQENYFAKPKKG